MYMELPKGFKYGDKPGKYVLKILQNIYGAAQAGRTWYNHVTKYLHDLGFQQSETDPCVSVLQEVHHASLCRRRDCRGPQPTRAYKRTIELIMDNVDVEDQGSIEDYVGVNVCHNNNGSMDLLQPHLIKSVLEDLHLTNKSKQRQRPHSPQ